MIKKLILFSALVGILLFAGDQTDADRPQGGYVKMRLGLMTASELGLDLDDTLASSNDTLFTRWVGDQNGSVNPYMFSVSIDIDQYKTQTGAHKLYMVWANDTTDIFLVDSALGNAAATFDTTYQEIPNGAAFYRWYVVAACTCIINDFRLQVSGYGN